MSDTETTTGMDALASLREGWKRIPSKQRDILSTLASVVTTRETDRDALASLRTIHTALKDASASLSNMSTPAGLDAGAWQTLVNSTSLAGAMSLAARDAVQDTADGSDVRKRAGGLLGVAEDAEVSEPVVLALTTLIARYDATAPVAGKRSESKRTSGDAGDLGFSVTVTCDDHPKFKRTASSRKHLQNVPLVHLQSEHPAFAMDKATRTALVSSIVDGASSVEVGSVRITRNV